MAGMGEGVCAAEYRQVRQGHSLWIALYGTVFTMAYSSSGGYFM